jgi:glycosyltransferase involved in cell wall biosynthesis
MKMLIGIPAYNEENMLGKAIKSLPKKIKGMEKIDILVVDDGSFDKTSDVAAKSGAVVIRHIINRGLGGALKTIFAYARRLDYDVLVTFDADGQHIGSDLPRLVDVYKDMKTDVVIGSRWKGEKHKPLVRYIINQLANYLTFMLFGIWTSDSQSGFRLFGRKAVRTINIQTDGMEVSSEIFREIKKNNLSFYEAPIKTVYTDYSRFKGQPISNSLNVFIQLLLRLFR